MLAGYRWRAADNGKQHTKKRLKGAFVHNRLMEKPNLEKSVVYLSRRVIAWRQM